MKLRKTLNNTVWQKNFIKYNKVNFYKIYYFFTSKIYKT